MAFQLETGSEFSTKEANQTGSELQESGLSNYGCCCFWTFPCFKTRQPDNWERVSKAEKEQDSAGSLWRKGINAVKKAREWSEIAAGPKWKTFIRRFNRTTVARSKTGKFQYDPLSYALNFDEGQGQDGQFEEDRAVRHLPARFVAVTVSTKASAEFGKDAPITT